MRRSVLLRTRKFALLFSIILAGVASYCFVPEEDWLDWGNKCLLQSYDPSAEVKLKKWELFLTDDSFIRFRKTYQNGKQEYFSLQLQRLDNIDYLGSVNKGTLQLVTKDDDIIVQTYHDRKGNVDSMTSVLNIPLKNMEPERIDSLKEALNYFKTKAL